MKFILIYGPPASGKLTIAQILAERTGFLLVHNHLVVDFVEPLFPRGTAGYNQLIRKIRLALLEETAVSNYPGLIFTMVFSPSRQNIVDAYCDAAEKLGGEACLIQVSCDQQTILERVGDASRKQWKKLTSPEKLRQLLGELEDPFQSVNGRPSLTIDSVKMMPETAVAKIIEYYDLQEEM